MTRKQATNEIELYVEGLERYPTGTIIFGNAMILLWFALGTAACWLLSPIAAGAYFVTAVVMVYFVLRKLVCTNCHYYDKWCSIGWGKLAARMFARGDPAKFATCIGIRIAPATYGLLMLVPLVLGLVAVARDFSYTGAAVLVLLFAVSFYSGVIARRRTCAQCRMRLVCPGCAVAVEVGEIEYIEPELRPSYIARLKELQDEESVGVGDFTERYGSP